MAALRLFTSLAILQTLGTMLGWLAALGDIEAIVVLGPLLSLTGLLVALSAAVRRHWLGGVFGLGVPLLSIGCFLTIFLNRWSPSEAYLPINSIIAVFVLGHAPLCALVIRDAERQLLRPEERFSYQFSIGGIMIFTGFIAATLGLQRALGFSGLTVAVLLWYAVVLAWYFWTEPRGRARGTNSPTSDVSS